MSKVLIKRLLREGLYKDEKFSGYNGRYMFDVGKAYEMIDNKTIGAEVRKFNPILLKQFSHPEFSGVNPNKLEKLRSQIDYSKPLGILVNFMNPDDGKTEWQLIDGNHRVRVAGEAGNSGLLYVVRNPEDVNQIMQVDKSKQHQLFPDEEMVDEVAVMGKEFRHGSFHKVYASNKHPDRLFKVGDKDTVNEWVRIFQKYPQFFPKIYRVFPYAKDPNLQVVEIEKLDADMASNDFHIIDMFLFVYSDELTCGDSFLTPENFFEPECFGQVVNKLESTGKSNLIPLFEKWAEFLRVAYPTLEHELGSHSNDRYPDLHLENVAYDNNKNIKFIDI